MLIQRWRSAAGQASGCWKEWTTPSRAGPRHCGQSAGASWRPRATGTAPSAPSRRITREAYRIRFDKEPVCPYSGQSLEEAGRQPRSRWGSCQEAGLAGLARGGIVKGFIAARCGVKQRLLATTLRLPAEHPYTVAAGRCMHGKHHREQSLTAPIAS